MFHKTNLLKSAMTAFLALAAAHSALGASADSSTASTEKCYGVVKAGMNDCATATASCAGSATKDNQPDAFVFMPTGLCDKLVGGHLKPEKK
jgi:uncharacterized membrane protein